MPVNFQNIINNCINLGYIVPGHNGVSNGKFAGSTKLPNCYFGEYDTNKSCFNYVTRSTIDRSIQTNPVIVILAESPHKDEYSYNNGAVTPKYPLYKSKSKIKNHLKNYLPSNLSGRYDVYLVNAIQYQCSFGLSLRTYRKQKNNVFALTWNIEPALDDLVCELAQLIKDERDLILNCCIKDLKKHLCMTDILKIKFSTVNILDYPHPSKW